MSRIGFVGVGVLGTPIARNLVAAGHEVQVHDLDPHAVKRLAEAGAAAADSPAAAAAGAEFVFTVLPRGAQVRAAVFGEAGIAETIATDALFIDMSTILPADSDEIGRRLAARGVAMLDCPVGRSPKHAAEGRLLLMVGGSAADLARARPLLERLGDTIVHCGPLGAGARMKMVNNYLSITLDVLTAEALTAAEAVGLDLDIVLEVLRGTVAGQGHLATTYPVQVLAGNLEPGFPIDHAEKDLGLATEMAAAVNAPAGLGAVARQALLRARVEGRGRQDWTAVYETLRGLAGLPDRR